MLTFISIKETSKKVHVLETVTPYTSILEKTADEFFSFLLDNLIIIRLLGCVIAVQ